MSQFFDLHIFRLLIKFNKKKINEAKHKIVAVYVEAVVYGKIIGPSTYIALSHDLEIEFQTTQLLPLELLFLKLSYEGTPAFRNIHKINFYTDELTNSTKIKVPCSSFKRAGPYVLNIEGNAINTTLSTDNNHSLEHKLDVRWPSAKLSVTHEVIETYEQSVSAVIEFVDVECAMDMSATTTSVTAAESTTNSYDDYYNIEMPSFQLELTYCGMYQVFCDSHSVPPNSTFLIQHIIGITRSIEIPINCEFFGLAGSYVLHLKPIPPLDSSLYATAFIKVKKILSLKFPLNLTFSQNCACRLIGVSSISSILWT